MSSGFVFIDGLDDVINDFDRVVNDIEEAGVEAVSKALKPIETNMRANADAVFTKGYSQGVMQRSISHNVNLNDSIITGTVGVYDMDVKTGTTERRAKEPNIAYWYEFGIQPHSTTPKAVAAKPASGGRKARKATRQGERMHQGSPATGFLTSAFDAGAENILPIIAKRLDKAARIK